MFIDVHRLEHDMFQLLGLAVWHFPGAELCTRPTLDSPGESRQLLFPGCFFDCSMVFWMVFPWFVDSFPMFFSICSVNFYCSLHVSQEKHVLCFLCFCFVHLFTPARPQTWPWSMVTMAMDPASIAMSISSNSKWDALPLQWWHVVMDWEWWFAHSFWLVAWWTPAHLRFWCWAFGFHVLYCLDVPGRWFKLLHAGMGRGATGQFHWGFSRMGYPKMDGL